MEKIILFDGTCNFCDYSVQFIIKRDPKKHFKFASLQSEVGKELLKAYNVSTDIDSMVFIENERSYTKSTAALHICKYLKGAWKILYILLLVPRLLRDFVYDYIAKNRYKWFGTTENCMLPTPEDRNRFL